MAYTDQEYNIPAGPFTGEAPWPRPFLPNNWPPPPWMKISAVQNQNVVNPMGPMPGVVPWPVPFSNTWPTPSETNFGPNTWPNDMPDLENGVWIQAEQNPFPHNYVGSGPLQTQLLSPYPTGLYFALQILLTPRQELLKTFVDEQTPLSYSL